MKNSAKKALGAVGATTAAFIFSLVSPSAAQADSAFGCDYPKACIYNGTSFTTSSIIGRFQDVTPSWQFLNHPETGYSVWNSRNDDTVYVEDSDGVYCIEPDSGVSSVGTITAIRIDTYPSC